MDIDKISKLAKEEIKRSYGTEDGEFGSTLFVSHHLQEIPGEYWLEKFGVEKPDPSKILDELILIPIDEEDELDSLDFTLPGNVTNYLLAVYLGENGEIDEISMES